MRFRNAAGLVDLPIYAVEHRFRNEPVLTVLPVRGGVGGRDALLVALPTELAVIIADPERRAAALVAAADMCSQKTGNIPRAVALYEAAIEVLKNSSRPLHFKKITEAAISRNLLSHVGKTPEHTMESRLNQEAEKTENPVIKRVRPGVFTLVSGVDVDTRFVGEPGNLHADRRGCFRLN